MSTIRITITKELEPVLKVLENRFEGLARTEIVKLALSNLKDSIIVPRNLPVEQASPELEKEIGEAMQEYYAGRYTSVSSPKELRNYFDKLNREVDEEDI